MAEGAEGTVSGLHCVSGRERKDLWEGEGGRLVWHRPGGHPGSRQVGQEAGHPQNPAQDAPTLPERGLTGRDPQKQESSSWGRRKSQPGLQTPPLPPNGLTWPKVGMGKLEASFQKVC